jgi:hypothetical protein
MSAIIPWLLGAAMLATLAVLVVGVVSFATGDGGASRTATRLMTMRVILQGVAVALFAVIVAFQMH